MPEGPSIVLVTEELKKFAGKKILLATGNAPIEVDVLTGKTLKEFKTFGKHLLLCFPKFTISIHFLMFGWYSIDEQNRVDKAVRLKLKFSNGTLYFYTCKVELFDTPADEIYDMTGDIMSKVWSVPKAVKKMMDEPKMMICDALMSQDIFAGVGNIIKNEVLYALKVHPESVIAKLSKPQLTAIAKEASRYSFDFLKWRRNEEFQKHWRAYNQKECERCALPMIRKATGKTKRTSFFCINCQEKYK